MVVYKTRPNMIYSFKIDTQRNTTSRGTVSHAREKVHWSKYYQNHRVFTKTNFKRIQVYLVLKRLYCPFAVKQSNPLELCCYMERNNTSFGTPSHFPPAIHYWNGTQESPTVPQ